MKQTISARCSRDMVSLVQGVVVVVVVVVVDDDVTVRLKVRVEQISRKYT